MRTKNDVMGQKELVEKLKETVNGIMGNEYKKLLNFINSNVSLKEQDPNKYFSGHWKRLTQDSKNTLEYFVRNYSEDKKALKLKEFRETLNKKGERIIEELKNKIKGFTSFEEAYSDSNLQVYKIANKDEVRYLKFEKIIVCGDKQRIHTRFLIRVNKKMPRNILKYI